MQIKPELLELLTDLGLDEDDVTELAGRLVSNADQYKAARENAERQLAQTQDVIAGLESTITDATARENRALNLLSKITVE